MTHLGKLIWWGLLKTGMTRKELADTLEVTPVSVSRWLRKQGDNLVSWHHYPGLAQALRVPLEDILEAANKDSRAYVRQFRRFYAKVPYGKVKARSGR